MWEARTTIPKVVLRPPQWCHEYPPHLTKIQTQIAKKKDERKILGSIPSTQAHICILFSKALVSLFFLFLFQSFI